MMYIALTLSAILNFGLYKVFLAKRVSVDSLSLVILAQSANQRYMQYTRYIIVNSTNPSSKQ
jgi:hypothetical protein